MGADSAPTPDVEAALALTLADHHQTHAGVCTCGWRSDYTRWSTTNKQWDAHLASALAAALRAAPQPDDGALTAEEREYLAYLSERSTPAPWNVSSRYGKVDVFRHPYNPGDEMIAESVDADDAALIVALRNGLPAILAARAAQRDPQPSEAALRLAGIAALHVPWYEGNGVRHDHTVIATGDDVPADHVCRISPEHQACHVYPESPEETEHEVLACVECRQATSDGETGYLFWPCPTARLAALAVQPSVPATDSWRPLIGDRAALARIVRDAHGDADAAAAAICGWITDNTK